MLRRPMPQHRSLHNQPLLRMAKTPAKPAKTVPKADIPKPKKRAVSADDSGAKKGVDKSPAITPEILATLGQPLVFDANLADEKKTFLPHQLLKKPNEGQKEGLCGGTWGWLVGHPFTLWRHADANGNRVYSIWSAKTKKAPAACVLHFTGKFSPEDGQVHLNSVRGAKQEGVEDSTALYELIKNSGLLTSHVGASLSFAVHHKIVKEKEGKERLFTDAKMGIVTAKRDKNYSSWASAIAIIVRALVGESKLDAALKVLHDENKELAAHKTHQKAKGNLEKEKAVREALVRVYTMMVETLTAKIAKTPDADANKKKYEESKGKYAAAIAEEEGKIEALEGRIEAAKPKDESKKDETKKDETKKDETKKDELRVLSGRVLNGQPIEQCTLSALNDRDGELFKAIKAATEALTKDGADKAAIEARIAEMQAEKAALKIEMDFRLKKDDPKKSEPKKPDETPAARLARLQNNMRRIERVDLAFEREKLGKAADADKPAIQAVIDAKLAEIQSLKGEIAQLEELLKPKQPKVSRSTQLEQQQGRLAEIVARITVLEGQAKRSTDEEGELARLNREKVDVEDAIDDLRG